MSCMEMSCRMSIRECFLISSQCETCFKNERRMELRPNFTHVNMFVCIQCSSRCVWIRVGSLLLVPSLALKLLHYTEVRERDGEEVIMWLGCFALSRLISVVTSFDYKAQFPSHVHR